MSEITIARRGEQFILSVRPEWVEKILDGRKLYEVRRTAPGLLREGATVLIYETRTGGGRGKVVGWFHCPKIHSRTNWRRVPELIRGSCLSVEELEEYQGARPYLCFWEVEGAEAMEVPLGIINFGLRCAPKSWCRVPRGYEW